MAKRINVKNHYTPEEWQKLIVKNQNLDVRFRMLAIERVLVNPDISSDEICLGLYISKQTFFRWIRWYNEGVARYIDKYNFRRFHSALNYEKPMNVYLGGMRKEV